METNFRRPGIEVSNAYIKTQEICDSEKDETKVGWELIFSVLLAFVMFVFFTIRIYEKQNNFNKDFREINLEVPTEAKVNAEVNYKNNIVELKNL